MILAVRFVNLMILFSLGVQSVQSLTSYVSAFVNFMLLHLVKRLNVLVLFTWMPWWNVFYRFLCTLLCFDRIKMYLRTIFIYYFFRKRWRKLMSLRHLGDLLLTWRVFRGMKRILQGVLLFLPKSSFCVMRGFR